MVTPTARPRSVAQDTAEWLLNLDPGPLEAFCTRTIHGFRTPLSIHPARPSSTSTFTVSTPDNRYALRRSIDSAHNADLEREFRMLAGLNQRNFPVPRPLIYCDNEKLIGNAFYVMEHVEGRHYNDPIMPGASSAYRAKAYESLNTVLAQLHSFDPRAIGVATAGNGRNYVADQVERCTKHYVAAKIEDIPEMDKLIAWLPKHLPPDRPSRLVHGDFRIENIVFHPSEPQVIGILNWKLAGLGDPIADAVYHFMAWILMGHGTSGGVSEEELAELGIPALEIYAASYAHRAGLKTIPHFETYFAYNLFRMAVLQGIATRNGKAKSVAQIRPIAALAWAFARRAGAT
ncbi:aminoglycoside phosphotransferase [Terrihabitans soli]|uniref:Aminoglycoside phosphotransferase n=1 Tax=Terrihabitans soli TaxID=708113 RepID=A0A6S6QQ60_9HYPH|nr:phosphotransferase family protein [Terrihabitans soli]BCJ91656.1 aminoglycoside phosphotransferase [Terrihabitans soli]